MFRSVRSFSCLVALFLAVQTTSPLLADDPAKTPVGISWQKGPTIAHLGDVADIQIPKGYAFADPAGAKRFMELNENPVSGHELGVIVPISIDKEKTDKSNSDEWFLLFEFDEMGYVRDDEKASIDAGKILSSLKENTEHANEYRKQHGWSAYHITGWETSPFYDNETHNLTWATLGHSDDPKSGTSVNYSTRILGRRGTMNVDLVLDASALATAVPRSKDLLAGFKFAPGSRYADFVQGDKVATYGLTALIAGGAAAAAVKTGFFAKIIGALAALWKLIAVAVAGAFAAIKRFFVRLKNRVSGEDTPNESQLSKYPETEVISSDHEPN
jgi:uncharacterized membrane-anchored protein